MTMHINLSTEMESYIKGKVSSGFYGNATEVIRDAIRRMQTEEERLAAFRVAVAKGEAQLNQKQGVTYSSTVMKRLTETAIKDMHSAKPMNPDVLP